MKTKITFWVEKGKPTKVRTMRTESSYVEDLSQVFEKPMTQVDRSRWYEILRKRKV